jgi:hypothetical protein
MKKKEFLESFGGPLGGQQLEIDEGELRLVVVHDSKRHVYQRVNDLGSGKPRLIYADIETDVADSQHS